MRRAKTDISLKDRQTSSLLPFASATDVLFIEDTPMSELAHIAVHQLCDHYDFLLNRGFPINQVSIRVRDMLLKLIQTFKLKNIQDEGSKFFLSYLFLNSIVYDVFLKFSSLC